MSLILKSLFSPTDKSGRTIMAHGLNPGCQLFCNKVLLELSHTVGLCIVCGHFYTTTVDLSRGNRDHTAHKAKIFTLCSFTWNIC